MTSIHISTLPAVILMPNRIIKESICTNEQIDQLSPFEETFFYRLIVNADDYGRMDGRPSILRARLFPLKSLRDDQIEKALCTLSTVELVRRYNVHGKPFVSLTGWERNQSIRAKKSKYPSPEEADDCNAARTSEITCMQMHADVPVIQSNPNPNPNQNPEAETRPREAASAAFNTLEAYASSNLTVLSPRNMEELVSFKADMPEELIRHAIDEACANGKRTWAYVRSILSRYLQKGIKSVGDAVADKESFQQQRQQKAPASNPALNYEQRTETNYSSTFIDLLGEYGGESK